MMENATLGEVKARCAELTAKYGDDCCKHCEFSELGCCDSPDKWLLEATPCCKAQPDLEAMLKGAEESCRQMYLKMDEAQRRADLFDEEIRRLRLIVSTVETMIGRKFDVC